MGSTISRKITVKQEHNSAKTKNELKPVRVDKVNIEGISRTHDDYLTRVPDNLFAATNREEVEAEMRNAGKYLLELGIFKEKITVVQDLDKTVRVTPNGSVVTFKVTELSRIVGEVEAEIGQNEGFLKVELAAPNMFGRGERLSLQGSYSNLKNTNATLFISKPFLHTALKDYKPKIGFGLFRKFSSVPASSYCTQNTGITLNCRFLTLVPLKLTHTLQYEASFKEISAINESSPVFVRENCGPRLASLVRLITTYDQRDNFVFPTQGLYVETTNEFCGLGGGDVSYILTKTHAEINIPLFFGCTAQICSKFGLIHNRNKLKNIPLDNLFTLGGPTTLRGFKTNGAGPHIDGYASGANSFWALGLHLWTPLPFKSYFGKYVDSTRMHYFYNFGNCSNSLNSFNKDFIRSAAGIGIAFDIHRARIEINYCFPITHKITDHVQKGLQIGMSFEFI